MREIIFDTETTGLDPRVERIIEIGAVELDGRFPTGRTFHHYIRPGDRRIDPEATRIHGITDADVAGKPLFADIIDQFLDFVGDAQLVAHNAGFDRDFINHELARLNRAAIPDDRFTDTLALARRKHPLGPNRLDDLCRRYGIDNSRRIHHGALLDAELLADVYIEMSGGRQAALGLSVAADGARTMIEGQLETEENAPMPRRASPLSPRLTEAERAAHAGLVAGLGDKAIWLKLDPGSAA
ncbi:MAG: DNA polymerase III subunit epsilon [Rhizobiaceae bacterium]|jgi:DNA polymerase-3 subunit epsilon|nr:DNA polymerase III subunit epsilon [Rhizobiaceae bacterium]